MALNSFSDVQLTCLKQMFAPLLPIHSFHLSKPDNHLWRKWALTHLYKPLWQGRPFSTGISKNCHNGSNNHMNVCQTDNVTFTLQHQFFCDWNLLQELETFDVRAWYRVQNPRFKTVFVDVPVQVLFRMFSGRHSKFTAFCECCLPQWVLVKLKFKSLLWLKAALVPLSLILELHVSITDQQKKRTISDFENLKWEWLRLSFLGVVILRL